MSTKLKLVSEIPLHILPPAPMLQWHEGTAVTLKQIMEKGSKKLHFLTMTSTRVKKFVLKGFFAAQLLFYLPRAVLL